MTARTDLPAPAKIVFPTIADRIGDHREFRLHGTREKRGFP
jgi:hypothetical protein